MSFGEQLQEVRRSNGMTQEQFAEALQVSRQAVSRWESGRSYPEVDKILYICNRYGVSIGTLFAEENPTPDSGRPQPPQTAAQPPKDSLFTSLDSFITNLSPKSKWIGMGILVGVALLTSAGGTFRIGVGECIALCTALVYACAIITTDRLSHRDDALVLGILQVGFLGFYALIGALLFESPRLPQTGSEWGIVLMLAIVCTGFGYTLQPVAQSHTSAQRVSLFCALSPMFAAIFGALLLKEKITVWSGLGMLLILGSILLPHFLKGDKQHDIQDGSV